MTKRKPWYILEKKRPWWQKFLLWLADSDTGYFFVAVILIVLFGMVSFFVGFRSIFAIAIVPFIIGIVITISSQCLLYKKFVTLIANSVRFCYLLFRVENGKVTETGWALWGKKDIYEILYDELQNYCSPLARLGTDVIEVSVTYTIGSEEYLMKLPFQAFLTQGSDLSLQELYEKVFSHKDASVKELVTKALDSAVLPHLGKIRCLLYDFATGKITDWERELNRVVGLIQMEKPFNNIVTARITAGPVKQEHIPPEIFETVSKRVIIFT